MIIFYIFSTKKMPKNEPHIFGFHIEIPDNYQEIYEVPQVHTN